MIISTSNIEEAKKLIKNAKERSIIVRAQNYEFNRKILEYGKFDILLSPEANAEKDNIKYLDSGLNHVIVEIAAKNNIAIGIDIKEIRNLDKKEKARRLARIKQNIEICKKAKAKIKCLNYKDKKDAFNLLISLGASTQQANEAISF